MSQIVTGEAVALDLRVARLGSRAVAALIDLAVQLGIVFVLIWMLTMADLRLDEAAGAAIGLVFYVLVFLGYPVGLESLWAGRTLGKAAMGLRVVRDDGGPIRFRHALVRGLVGLFTERPGITVGILAIVISLISARSKRLGDLAAGTLVIQERVPIRYTHGIFMPPPLIPWAQSLDLSRLPDDLALAARQFLDRAPQLEHSAREQVGHSIASAVVAAVTPPAPPPGAPGWAILSAVLAERRRRDEMRMHQQRYAGTAAGPAGGGPGAPPWQQQGQQLAGQPAPAPQHSGWGQLPGWEAEPDGRSQPLWEAQPGWQAQPGASPPPAVPPWPGTTPEPEPSGGGPAMPPQPYVPPEPYVPAPPYIGPSPTVPRPPELPPSTYSPPAPPTIPPLEPTPPRPDQPVEDQAVPPSQPADEPEPPDEPPRAPDHGSFAPPT